MHINLRFTDGQVSTLLDGVDFLSKILQVEYKNNNANKRYQNALKNQIKETYELSKLLNNELKQLGGDL